MCIAEILEQNNAFRSQIEWLRKNSPYYPEVTYKEFGDEFIASTLIRKEKDGKWYDIHLVQRAVRDLDEKLQLPVRIMHYAYKIILFHIISDMDKLSEIQISEADRLIPKP